MRIGTFAPSRLTEPAKSVSQNRGQCLRATQCCRSISLTSDDSFQTKAIIEQRKTVTPNDVNAMFGSELTVELL